MKSNADKLFELSTKNPIGIMVYNNLEFLGMPLDVAIREFRDSGYCCEFARLFEAPELFFKYITEELIPSEENQNGHIAGLTISMMQGVT